MRAVKRNYRYWKRGGNKNRLLKWLLKRYIRREYGERCKSFDFGCGLCQAWLSYYYLFTDKPQWDEKRGQWYLEPLDTENEVINTAKAYPLDGDTGG